MGGRPFVATAAADIVSCPETHTRTSASAHICVRVRIHVRIAAGFTPQIVDKVEVGLGKEKVMLESMAAKELEPVLLESQQQLDELKQVYALLAEDRDRKRRARTVDQKTKDLNTKEIEDGFEQVGAVAGWCG